MNQVRYLNQDKNQGMESMGFIDENYFGTTEQIVIDKKKFHPPPIPSDDLIPLNLLSEDEGDSNPIELLYFGGSKTLEQENVNDSVNIENNFKEDELSFIDQQFFVNECDEKIKPDS